MDTSEIFITEGNNQRLRNEKLNTQTTQKILK